MFDLSPGCVGNLFVFISCSYAKTAGSVRSYNVYFDFSTDTMSFLLELDDLKDAAPSVVSHCGIVYCSDNTIGWKSVFKSWLKGAHTKWNISIRG